MVLEYLDRIRKAGYSDSEILGALVSTMSEAEAIEKFEIIVDAFNIVNKEATADSQELNLTNYQVDSLARSLFLEPEFETCWFDDADPHALVDLITRIVQKKYPNYSNIEKTVSRVFDSITNMLRAK